MRLVLSVNAERPVTGSKSTGVVADRRREGMATELDSGGGSKRRRTGEGGERAHPGAGAAEEDRISSLPEALRLHILGLLPFKSAVRTGALSTGWRALWAHRWPAPSSLDLRLKTHAPPAPILESLERRGRRRLDRLSLTFQIGKGDLEPDGVHRILDYAADLHVDFAHRALGFIFKLRLPRGDAHLTRLTVGGIRVGLSKPFCARSHTFSVLEVIYLDGVTLSDHTVENLVAACPLLRTLDLRYCDGLDFVNLEAAGPHLRSLTVAECGGVRDICTMEAPSLRSFRYSGSYIRALTIPATCALADLYLCFGGPAGRLRPLGTPLCFDFAWPAGVPRNWLQALTNLSSLTVLTLCSSALRRVSAKARERSLTKSGAASCKLRNLRELQLLMFAMYNSSLDDIYVFMVACCPPLLERLFVQLPTNSHYYRLGSEQSESEEELLEENGPVEELRGEEAPEENGPEEELPEEEDELQEELLEGELAEEEDELQDKLPEGELSEEEDELQDELPEGELSEEEDELRDELPEGEASEENQSEEDWSDEELSDGGQSEEEPVEGCLENLKLLKMTNFKGGDNEMRLLRFVLRNSTSLNQLLLFTSKSDRPEWLQKDHLDTSDILETKILPLQKALPNCQIILGESDGDAIQAFHREAFVDRLVSFSLA
ncbi:unnamed protein product [Triticum turgidum subsp. durum]|uniref:FBD domain-containing protein n=1 Tax=Triticum turgidum subsp. durum TaxID=4567 RepID=A0A9R0WPA9_TRITD|nr:unnamed protein product [Triticum turgidum subsp. durum]